MLTKPKLNDQEITQCLLDAYDIKVDQISFLPLGANLCTNCGIQTHSICIY